MNDELRRQSRILAVYDIAHRWFAFFEGQTEQVAHHLDIFSPDIKLTHAGIHLLAEGRDGMEQWLKNLPYEKGSHFIRKLDFISEAGELAEVHMDISYQVLGVDQLVGGALSEYRTRVSFDDAQNATFTYIQKTPISPNPDKMFKESFSENRMQSFISHFVLLTNSAGNSFPLWGKE